MPSTSNYAARATRYARSVVEGKLPAPKYVQLACQRHLDDLSAESEYKFDSERANRICRFAENMVHIKGKWAGPKIKLGD